MITDLQITNFRGFDTLELNGLQRVNLIVGQNNAGKTSLLEAICLAVDKWTLKGLPDRFREHEGSAENRYYPWLVKDGSPELILRATTSDGAFRALFRSVSPGLERPPDTHELASVGREYEMSFSGGHLVIRANPSHTRPTSALAKAFSAAKSRRHVEKIVEILAKIDPRITDVDLFHDDDGPLVKADIGLREYVPLAQLGQGVGRLVGLLSDLLGGGVQVCLIDEIENGLHYTVLKQLWRGIAEITSALDVQIFATTHSLECLEAARRVFVAEDPKGERSFAVIQLMRVKDRILGKVLSEERVDEALENDIELR